ncbi:two-component regulator propeller domain-containing protein [candidate division KSB1 bacterium]
MRSIFAVSITAYLLFLPVALTPQEKRWVSFTDHNVKSIAIEADGTIWFGTFEGGLLRFDGTYWTSYNSATGFPGDNVFAIGIDPGGHVWFCCVAPSPPVAIEFDGGGWAEHSLPNTAFAVVFEPDGTGWFATAQGVSRYFSGDWVTYTTSDGLIHNSVRTVAVDPAGNKWFGTSEGISRYNGTHWTSYTTADGLAHDHVRASASGTDGSIWFGTDGGGVSRFDGVSWTTYTTASTSGGLVFDEVCAIAVDANGNVWFGTDGAGVSVFDGASWSCFNTQDGLTNGAVQAIAFDEEGNAWFGTQRGISAYGVLTGIPVGIENGSPGIPGEYRLPGNYPNPFNAGTVIPFYLALSSVVKIDVYTVCGRKVVTLMDDLLPSGRHEIVWNGTDRAGHTVSSGVYFFTFSAGSCTSTGKMVCVR